MTVIVIRGNVMAADSGMWNEDSLTSDTETKVIRCKWGLFAISGFAGAQRVAKKVFDEAEEIPDKLDGIGDNTNVYLLRNDGSIRLYCDGGYNEVRHEFYAVGAAGPVALGAMHAGADAVTACQIAIKVGPWAAGAVQSLAVGLPDAQGTLTAEEVLSGEVDPQELYDPEDETPLWRKVRGL